MKTEKGIAVVFAFVILILLGVLVFVSPAHGPTVLQNTSSTISTLSSDGHMQVLSPAPKDLVSSPATISGQVTSGGWFFEGSFPVQILDADGRVLGAGPAQAGGVPGDWTSTGTVPFSARITFAPPRYATGTIAFFKDNPSGAPQNALQFSLPISFVVQKQPEGGVKGQVVLAPICPVESIPPKPACAPRGYKTSIVISQAASPATVYHTITTSASGTFSVALPVGAYIFAPSGGASNSGYPRCVQASVTVIADQMKTATFQCDTGIR